jgi:thiol-disulfide isomerase/thioredoxin
MKSQHILSTGLMILACTGSGFVWANNLHVGDTAPPLRVDRWMKGMPVADFEKGKVYVVEFWATWCGPCKMAMPHLSELAKKYAGKVTFIGVDIWEDEHSTPGEDLKTRANKFVQEMGDRMSYNVCSGSDDGYMAKNWMKAAGQDGIPATFVIGTDGKIDWIGHPDYLADTLGQIVEGTYDLKAFAAKKNVEIDKERATSDVQARLMKPIETAVKAEKYELAVRECDKAIANSTPGYTYGFAMRKYEILVKHFPEKAYSEAQRFQSDPAQSWMASEIFATTPGLNKDCYMYALKFFQQKYKDQPQNPNGYAHYASVYFQLGEPAKAAEFFQQYVDGIKKLNLDPVTMSSIDKQLKKYQDAAAGK